MKEIWTWFLVPLLAGASFAQSVESSWRQFQTELVLVTSSSPEFMESANQQFLELLGAGTAEEKSQRDELLRQAEASLMAAPKVVTMDGFGAKMVVGDDVEYFVASSDGHFEPKSRFFGVTFDFTIHALDASLVNIDFESQISTMEGRMPLPGTKLDVGPPKIRLQKRTSKLTIDLGRWVAFDAGLPPPPSESRDTTRERIYGFFRVTENQITDEERERIRARYEESGVQRREEP